MTNLQDHLLTYTLGLGLMLVTSFVVAVLAAALAYFDGARGIGSKEDAVALVLMSTALVAIICLLVFGPFGAGIAIRSLINI